MSYPNYSLMMKSLDFGTVLGVHIESTGTVDVIKGILAVEAIFGPISSVVADAGTGLCQDNLRSILNPKMVEEVNKNWGRAKKTLAGSSRSKTYQPTVNVAIMQGLV